MSEGLAPAGLAGLCSISLSHRATAAASGWVLAPGSSLLLGLNVNGFKLGTPGKSLLLMSFSDLV